jgi:hypothetical protein
MKLIKSKMAEEHRLINLKRQQYSLDVESCRQQEAKACFVRQERPGSEPREYQTVHRAHCVTRQIVKGCQIVLIRSTVFCVCSYQANRA